MGVAFGSNAVAQPILNHKILGIGSMSTLRLLVEAQHLLTALPVPPG